MINRAPKCTNPFQILKNEGDEGIDQSKEIEQSQLITIGSIEINQIEIMEEDEVEDMDMDAI